MLDSDRDESVSRVEFDNFVNFLRRLLAVVDNNKDCTGFNWYKTYVAPICAVIIFFNEVTVEEVLEAFDRAHLPKVEF